MVIMTNKVQVNYIPSFWNDSWVTAVWGWCIPYTCVHSVIVLRTFFQSTWFVLFWTPNNVRAHICVPLWCSSCINQSYLDRESIYDQDLDQSYLDLESIYNLDLDQSYWHPGYCVLSHCLKKSQQTPFGELGKHNKRSVIKYQPCFICEYFCRGFEALSLLNLAGRFERMKYQQGVQCVHPEDCLWICLVTAKVLKETRH